MATILIGYDLHPTRGETYEELVSAIKALGAWWHHLDSTWIVKCNDTPVQVRDRLRQHVLSDDQLLVVDISGDAAAWFGFNESGSKWLKDNI
ncbi:hypothetical protein Q3C01_15815 [Bradyrhizobium sp. UFLA05-109]